MNGGNAIPLVAKRLIVHNSFKKTLDALKATNIRLPQQSSPVAMDYQWINSNPTDDLVFNLENIEGYDLDVKEGEIISQDPNVLIAGYDESINKFSALEGTAYYTSHSLVFLAPDSYVPINQLTMYFFTRSKELSDRSGGSLMYSLQPAMDSQKMYLDDKVDFIFSSVPNNSILFIDGPIIAGDVYTHLVSKFPGFHERNIVPCFFVKNSDSNMVIDNIKEVRGRYNSDLHWSYSVLKNGQRSCFFKYVDRNNPRNTKIFCYLKAFGVIPLRVEFYTTSFEKYSNNINNILNLIYYLLLVQGDPKNPQIRPIAIAEAYARETLKVVNFEQTMRSVGLKPTMNQERFAW